MDYKIQVLLAFVIIITSVFIANAETTGNLNLGTQNTSITSGIYGYTVSSTCTSNNNCQGYYCFFDHDTSGTNTNTSGSCLPADITGCIHDNSTEPITIVPSGYYYCSSSTTYASCNSKLWGNIQSCGTNQTCSPGIVSSSNPCSGSSGTTGTGSTGGGGSGTASTANGKISISLSNTTVQITQGSSLSVIATIQNVGNITLSNITLSVSGVPNTWYTISPSMMTIGFGNSNTFTVAFSIPSTIDVKDYGATITATAKDGTTNSAPLTVRILPSAGTITDIKNTFNSYSSIFNTLQVNFSNIDSLNLTAESLTTIKNGISSIKNKLDLANDSITKGDYFNAKLLLDSAKSLMDQLKGQPLVFAVLNTTDNSTSGNQTGESAIYVSNNTIFIVAGIVVAIIAVLLYMFFPRDAVKNYKFKKKE